MRRPAAYNRASAYGELLGSRRVGRRLRVSAVSWRVFSEIAERAKQGRDHRRDHVGMDDERIRLRGPAATKFATNTR